MNHRDLTGDDVLQERDDVCWLKTNVWKRVPVQWVGLPVSNFNFGSYTFRRPLTPAEITAANRVKFEAWNIDCGIKPSDLEKDERGDYFVPLTWDNWRAWCAAVNCDPMGDVECDDQ